MKFRLDAIRHGFRAAYSPAAGAFSCLLKPCFFFFLFPFCLPPVRCLCFIWICFHPEQPNFPSHCSSPREVRSVADLKSAQSSVLRIFLHRRGRLFFFFLFFCAFSPDAFFLSPLLLFLPTTPQHNACVGCWIVSAQRTGLGEIQHHISREQLRVDAVWMGSVSCSS